jgi:hypothetical protein
MYTLASDFESPKLTRALNILSKLILSIPLL